MAEAIQNRCKNMILGALVADAAAMGLHWIYDQSHIRKIAPDVPEFSAPDPKNYEGVMGFFAHPNRTAGAQSQYGEQAVVMLRTLAASGGHFEEAAFADAFQAHFGYGGGYVGYIDHATRATLDNMRHFEDAAMACIETDPSDAPARIGKSVLGKALPLLMRHSGTALNQEFEEQIRATYDDDAIVTYAMLLLDKLKKVPLPTGAHDLQLPAIAKLPPLVALLVSRNQNAAFDGIVASAVKTTNDHPTAAHYGLISAHMIRGALTYGTSADAVRAARSIAQGEAVTLLDKAIAMRDESCENVTQQFGMACDLPFGVPSAAHNIATAPSFSDAIRRNIYAGGDTCGRAILVGAVMGAIYGCGGAQGIPAEWVAHLEKRTEVSNLLKVLFE
ncbi:ADP-ribosylglycohydrolase family protein [uncultured Sulfitobacter sp.]|uniref:ADP-ribosylglycohydrolase family protein n=1 Tax=uncultured Sulfitobacter sp. TaxID=191468 RepID=UPI0026252ED0|nr:ADP-ribosylglycohydrolase family protein [uncultured Sulfitobacter sp.]